MKGILFACVANSARSQLAEGIARSIVPAGTKVWSAGSCPTSVRPEAIAVMQEIGIDISHHRSKAVTEIPAAEVDTVITLCGQEECPLFVGKAQRLHWGLPDPVAVSGCEEERLNAFRNVRDELRRRLDAWLAGNKPEGATMSEFIEATVDKFTFRVATDRRYSCEGLWVHCISSSPASRVRIGMTDFLQQNSGDVAFVTVRPPGTRLQVGDALADLETIKIVTVLASPVSGTLVTVNDELETKPELVNQSPYDKGWLAEVEVQDWQTAQAELLDAEAYFAVMQAQAQEELKK